MTTDTPRTQAANLVWPFLAWGFRLTLCFLTGWAILWMAREAGAALGPMAVFVSLGGTVAGLIYGAVTDREEPALWKYCGWALAGCVSGVIIAIELNIIMIALFLYMIKKT